MEKITLLILAVLHLLVFAYLVSKNKNVYFPNTAEQYENHLFWENWENDSIPEDEYTEND